MRNLICAIVFLLGSQLYASSIDIEWGGTIGNVSIESISSMNYDSKGNLIISGDFSGDCDFDPSKGDHIIEASGHYHGFILKLDSAGDFLWVKTFQIDGSNADAEIVDVVIDSEDNIVFCGTTKDTIRINNTVQLPNVYSSGKLTGFWGVMDKDGNIQSSMGLESTGNTFPTGICIDKEDNISIIGSYYGEAVFDPSSPSTSTKISGNNGRETFIASYTNTGTFRWVNCLSSGGNVFPKDIASDGNGNLYATCDISSYLVENPYNSWSLNTFDNSSAIVKYNSNGDLIFGKLISTEGTAFTQIWNINVLNNESLIISGIFNGKVDLNPDKDVESLFTCKNTTGFEKSSLYVVSLDLNGEYQWAHQFDGKYAAVYPHCQHTDKSNGIYVGGRYKGTVDWDPSIAEENTTPIDFWDDLFLVKLNHDGEFIWKYTNGDLSNDYVDAVAVNDSGDVAFTGRFSSNIIDWDPSDSVFVMWERTSKGNYILGFKQDICSNLSVSFDSISHVTCTDSGAVIISTKKGRSPYQYEWVNSIRDTDSLALYNVSGWYNVSVIDSNNCELNRKFKINGPTNSNNADINSFLDIDEFRPGFESIVSVDLFNSGCATVNGQFYLVLDSLVQYTSASTTPNSISGDTLFWEIPALKYDFSSWNLSIVVETIIGTMGGDTVKLTTNFISYGGPSNSVQNNYSYIVQNGYDPNNLAATPQGVCDEKYIKNNESISYKVRFQNTGNSKAINIEIRDTLSQSINPVSFHLIERSHPQLVTTLEEDSIVVFSFPLINLPDSISDEEGSKGYIIFSVDIFPNITDYRVLENTAHIYFDFNPVVVTNTVTQIIVSDIPNCSGTITSSNDVLSGLKIFPSPAKEIINISVDNMNINNGIVEIFNQAGQKVVCKNINSSHENIFQIETNHLANGVYTIKFKSEKKVFTSKVLISK